MGAVAGLNLSGTKSHRTALVVLQHYPKEHKTFVLDVFDRVETAPAQHPDDALIELLQELADQAHAHFGPHERVALGVDVPLSAPPCFTCAEARPRRVAPTRCPHPEARWMHRFVQRETRGEQIATPYTQRAVELWIRHRELPATPDWLRFEVDEALGSTKAPLTARMLSLAPYLPRGLDALEVWPKLTLARLAPGLGLPRRVFQAYRKLDEGVRARHQILDALAERHDVFIYERDQRKLATHLHTFDALLTAWGAHLFGQGLAAPRPRGFPKQAAWVVFPAREDDGT